MTQAEVHRCRFVDYSPHTITSLAFSHSSTQKFSPTDLRLAVGRNNGDVELWNPKGKWLHEMTLQGGKDRSVEALAWCSAEDDAPRLFSIGGTSSVIEWDLRTGRVLKETDSNAAVIWSIATSPDQKTLALGCDDGTVVLLDISGGIGSVEHKSFLQRQDARVLSLCWAGNDKVVGGCADGRIRVWDSNDRRLLSTMRVDKSKTESTLVWSVLHLSERNQIVSGDSTGAVKFWDLQHTTLLQSFKVHEADVLTLSTDLSNDSVFTAGVDRKIFKFQQVEHQGQKKWLNVSNRLFHSNDVRAMASYQSRNFSFLVSGGVEKTVVISGLANFTDGQYRKLSIIPQRQHVILNRRERLIVMWQDQVVKIWRLVLKKKLGNDDESDADDDVEELQESFELVAKLTLADEDNITTCSLSEDGSILAVGRLSTTKLFRLKPKSKGANKLFVSKISYPALNALGASHLAFYGNTHIITTTPENEVYKFSLEDTEADPVEYTLSELPRSKSKLPYLENVSRIAVHHSTLIVARGSAVDVIDVEVSTAEESTPFIRLSSVISQLTVAPSRETLIVITSESKIYEFSLADTHLTSWSKSNSEFLPQQYLSIADPAIDCFFSSKLWVYGASWIACFDLDRNVPVKKTGKGKKRSHNGALLIGHNTEVIPAEDDDDLMSDGDGDDAIVPDVHEREKNAKTDNSAYSLTKKYQGILFADGLDDEQMLIVERPLSALKQPPAFKLQQYRV